MVKPAMHQHEKWSKEQTEPMKTMVEECNTIGCYPVLKKELNEKVRWQCLFETEMKTGVLISDAHNAVLTDTSLIWINYEGDLLDPLAPRFSQARRLNISVYMFFMIHGLFFAGDRLVLSAECKTVFNAFHAGLASMAASAHTSFIHAESVSQYNKIQNFNSPKSIIQESFLKKLS